MIPNKMTKIKKKLKNNLFEALNLAFQYLYY